MLFRWHDAIRTLAKLHRIDPNSVGLSDFGKTSGFYERQIKTLNTISASQAQAIDVDTKLPVGKIPHFDEMVAFFKDPITQPKDRVALIHGDYKIDNLVFHNTEPRVIGILEYILFYSTNLSESKAWLLMCTSIAGKCPQSGTRFPTCQTFFPHSFSHVIPLLPLYLPTRISLSHRMSAHPVFRLVIDV